MDQPKIETPNGLFSGSFRYYAPVFQREYVWRRKEWEALSADISSIEDGDTQFLGAIVLKNIDRMGGLQSPDQWLVIDGQQRLTTIYLVLLAIASVALENDDADTADSIWNSHLAETKKRSEFHGLPKFVPTLQDRPSFYEILRTALPCFESRWNLIKDPSDTQGRKSMTLQRQWERVRSWVEKFAKEGENYSSKRLEELQERVLDRLQLILISLDEEDNESDIFDRLNAKGVPLELADLVRNEVFGKFAAASAKDAQRFFEERWKPFQDRFSPGQLSAFFPVFAFVKLESKATKATAFGGLQRLWNRRKPQDILKELQEYSDFHCALCDFAPIDGVSQKVNDAVECLSRMPKTNVTWPFIFELLHASRKGELSPKDAERSLRIVESFLVRRALCGFEPTGLHTVFRSLWKKTGGKPASLQKSIITRTIECPSDDEIQKTLMAEPIDTRRVRWFIFSEWERAETIRLRGDGQLNLPVTIEHVMPRNHTKEWQKLVKPADHQRYLGLIGNLAALSERQNKGLKDSPWEAKSERYKDSTFLTTRRLAGYKRWTTEVIEERTAKMTEWVVKRWPEIDG
jgi:hypothetical protein